MNNSVKLLAHYSRLHTISDSLPDLKQEITTLCGKRIRRVDRYIELCLLGALHCVAERTLPNNTAVYLATRCGAVETSSQAMSNIFQLRQPPKPLHFVNTLGNTACFYLTQKLGINGQALVLSQEQLSFEAALFQACVDIQMGAVETALVGGIDEVTLPLSQQAQRLGSPDAEQLLEGSHWLLLAKADNTPTLTRPEYLQGMPQVLTWLETQPPGPVQICFSPSATEWQALRNTRREIVDASAVQRYQALEHGVYSGAALVDLLAGNGRSIHLARSGDSYCAVTVKVALTSA